MQHTPLTPALTRIPSLWFDDDNLILRAESSLFRVSKGVLAARSSVFRDMLSFPVPPRPPPPSASAASSAARRICGGCGSPRMEGLDGMGMEGVEGAEDEDGLIDGCPVVRLHDSAADVTVFLRAIFDSGFFEPPPSKTDLATITGILRLAHKYDVQYLRRRALQHLDTGYPTSLAVYEVSGAETFSSDGLDDSLRTIQCASEVGAMWILPTAFYFLCYSDMRDILAAPSYARLSGADQETVVISYTKQRLACPPVLPFLRIPFTEGCTALAGCSAYRASYLVDVGSWNISDPLGSYKDWTPFEGRICAYCLQQSEEYHRTARKKLWEELPAIYSLPPWDVLERMKAESLALEGEGA
ncbi:hypothetical protein DFH06DRAFT_1418543 [Mycena polygramma]|nr:hypothetical protein DFH06DRAFT_1418543 [Mycena polygramma]